MSHQIVNKLAHEKKNTSSKRIPHSSATVFCCYCFIHCNILNKTLSTSIKFIFSYRFLLFARKNFFMVWCLWIDRNWWMELQIRFGLRRDLLKKLRTGLKCNKFLNCFWWKFFTIDKVCDDKNIGYVQYSRGLWDNPSIFSMIILR